MRMTTFMAMSALLLFGCNAHHSSGGLQLNKGAKWTVNAEMKPHIEKAADVLDAYVSQQSTDYLSLAAQLKEQNDLLIQSCTMKGKSHDELHKWLHPHIELVTALAKAGSSAEAESIVAHIAESFETYQNFFQ